MGVEDCRRVLRARLTLSKGDKPYSSCDLSSKIDKIWKTKAGWKMVPLGKGYFDFHFELAEDLKKIWAVGTVNLKPGLLRFSQWTKDFKLLEQKQTHVLLWIRLVELPQEYWRERTLMEIASEVGTPIDIHGQIVQTQNSSGDSNVDARASMRLTSNLSTNYECETSPKHKIYFTKFKS